MMKKSKTDLEAAQAVLQAPTSPATLRGELASALRGALNESNARGFHYMISYYGLGESKGMTLEAIGEKVAGGLTRERVRQIIDGALAILLKQEAGSGQIKPYERARERFERMLAERSSEFLRLSDFVQEGYFESFAQNAKGLIAFLNDAGIRQVVYRGAHYIYPDRLDRRDAIEHIQSENKKARRSRTLEKMGQMAKTVTYVPTETREFLLESAKASDTALNRLYEGILKDFMGQAPYKGSADFAKTQSWRARQGKAEWSQVGIYIEKDVFDQVKEKASKVKPEAVSNMSYICQAFVWFSKKK